MYSNGLLIRLALRLVPHRIVWQCVKGKQELEVQGALWSLIMEHGRWTLDVSLLGRLLKNRR